MGKRMMHVYVDDNDRTRLEAMARRSGVSLSEVLRRGIEMHLALAETGALGEIEALREELAGIPASRFVANIVADYCARVIARKSTWGPHPVILPEVEARRRGLHGSDPRDLVPLLQRMHLCEEYEKRRREYLAKRSRGRLTETEERHLSSIERYLENQCGADGIS